MDISFSLLLICLLSLPGIALVYSSNIQQNRFIVCIGFSYSLFAISVSSTRYFSLDHTTFINIVASYLSISLATLIFKFIHQKTASTARFRLNHYRLENHFENYIAIAIGFCVCAYHFLVQPYIEIPADIYTHTERYQTALLQQANNTLGPTLTLKKLLLQHGNVWYHLLASIATISNSSIESVVYAATLINKIIFLISVYFFAISLFKKQSNAILIALTASGFVALHMGINVFAYLRYYSFAPTMLNFVLYLAAISLFMQGIQQPLQKNNIALILLISLMTLAASTIHTQEAMFIIIVCFLITAVMASQSTWRLTHGTSTQKTTDITHLSLALISIIGFATAYLFAHEYLNRAPNVQWRLWEFGHSDGLLPSLTTLNLKYQFIRVITLWGCFVYLLFFLHWSRYKHNVFIVAGMLSPAFTILNPFFIDLFLRLDNATTLWRLCYIIPIHFVAADLFIHYSYTVKKRVNWQQTGIAISIIGLLIILLLPIQNTWQQVHYSRFPTLAAVPKQNSYQHLDDLLDYLNSVKQKQLILTDPITGYVVSGMTHHHSARRKFHRDRYTNFTFNTYNNDPLKVYRGRLLIINLRTKGHSITGKLANHWPKDILNNIKQYYPERLLKYIQTSPQRFQQQWANDNIAVYLIR